ncbi:hypothetical protein BV25DRAFT_1842776 [Artomyces pyxidatus]|uniref:Uncharacterized protein n=1 Tax=Artomyces pyxidatus TaxID=48021 RepID=A0ACB8SHI5_9AGAM|nr:hypothetical protein BV25DRAFT_1842776 [Artomyces pyxidatus]
MSSTSGSEAPLHISTLLTTLQSRFRDSGGDPATMSTSVTPLNSAGFHSSFISDADKRTAARIALETVIAEAVTALDHFCGVGSYVVLIRAGVEHPTTNLAIHVSENLQRDSAFPPILAEMEERVSLRLAPLFLRDWCIRAAASGHVVPSQTVVKSVRGGERLSSRSPSILPERVLDHLSREGCPLEMLDLVRDVIDDVGVSNYELEWDEPCMARQNLTIITSPAEFHVLDILWKLSAENIKGTCIEPNAPLQKQDGDH